MESLVIESDTVKEGKCEISSDQKNKKMWFDQIRMLDLPDQTFTSKANEV